MKKRNKILLIILIVFIVIAVVLSVIAYKNRDIISTMYYVLTDQTQQIEKEKLENDKRVLEAVKEFGIEDINPLSKEETEQLKSGELSQEEAIDIVLGRNEENSDETSEQSPSKNGEGTSNQSTNSSGSQGSSKDNPNSQGQSGQSAQSEEYKQKNEEISRLIGELYVLKAEFTSDLSAIENWVNDQYWIYTLEYGEGNIPSSIKTKIGKKAYADALALEEACDVKVYAILDKVEILLKETGQSTTLVSEMKAAYNSEKKSAISYYMSQH